MENIIAMSCPVGLVIVVGREAVPPFANWGKTTVKRRKNV
jgi:hypothetical protein